MKFNKKMLLKISVFVFVICLMINSNIYGASAYLSASKTSVEVGETITVNVNVSGAATWQITATSSGSVTNTSQTFVRSDDGIDDVTKSVGSLTLTANSVGTGTVKISGNAYTSDGSPISVSSQISITVNEKKQTTTPSTPQTGTSNNTTNNTGNTNTNTTNKTTTTSTLSSNAYLSKLQVNVEGLSPKFSKSVTNYSLNVGSDINEIAVTAVAEVSKSKISIVGNKELQYGDNTVTITVTAENGTKKVYTIVVTKAANPDDSNSYLENLIVENATLSPEFSREVLEYDCGTVDVETLKILAFPEIEDANVEIIGNDTLVEGENNVIIKITSRDGSTVKEYKIKVIKKVETVETAAMVDSSEEELPKEGAFDNILYVIKENALILIMYAFIIVEFIEIVYLYCKLHNITFSKKKRKNINKKSKVNVELNVENKKSKKNNEKIDFDIEREYEQSLKESKMESVENSINDDIDLSYDLDVDKNEKANVELKFREGRNGSSKK